MLASIALAGVMVLDRVKGSGLITDPDTLKGLVLASSILFGLLRLDTDEAIQIRKEPEEGAPHPPVTAVG